MTEEHDWRDHFQKQNPFKAPPNKIGIEDKEELRKLEYKIVEMRAAELEQNPSSITKTFDAAHLKKIHEHLFQDVYDWAGKERLYNISKQKSKFLDKDKIGKALDLISLSLQNNKNLKGLKVFDFAAKASEYHTNLNRVHPFEEGNGRATRVFMGEIAKEAGFIIQWDRVDPKEWLAASKEGMDGRSPLMKSIYSRITFPDLGVKKKQEKGLGKVWESRQEVELKP